MKPVWLITRAIEHAISTQNDVAALGCNTLIDPLLEIEPVVDILPIGATAAALIVTSRNALHGLKKLEHAQHLPLFVVGQETAMALAGAGFKKVWGIAQQSGELPALIKQHLSANAGGLVHVTSPHAHTEFYDPLLDAGYGIDQRIVYNAHPARDLRPETVHALEKGELTGVLFYSARTAEIFGTLVKKTEQGGRVLQLDRLCAITLSAAVAAVLESSRWNQVVVAPAPTHAALMQALRDTLAKRV